MSGPLILSIESSCDETGIALISGERRILSNVVASQVALHAPSGGIVPEVAARAHLRWIVPVLDEAWDGTGVAWSDVDGIAVTYGPGLAGSLLVGINFAKALSWVHDVPLIPMAHWGVQQIMPRYSKKVSLFPRKSVEAIIGDPVDLTPWRGRPITHELLVEATEAVMVEITRLLEQLRGETAPLERWDPSAHGQTETGRF